MPISDFYKIKPNELDKLPLSDELRSQVKNDAGYQAAHGLADPESLVVNPPPPVAEKPVAPTNPANDVAFNPFAPTNTPGYKPPAEPVASEQPQQAPEAQPQAAKPMSSGGPAKPIVPIDSFDQYQSKIAGLDSQAAEIDAAVANGAMSPQDALGKKAALDAQRQAVTTRDNYDASGNFNWANAAKNPKAYSYDRLKSEYVNSQFDYQKKQQEAGQATLGAIQAGADAEKAKAEAIAAQYGEQAQVAEKNRIELEAQQKNYEVGLAQMNQSKQNAVDDYMNTQIDPNRSWKNLGVGGGIFTAIVAGLAGAYANRAAGGVVENPIVKQMNTIIDRDIDAQKSQLAKKRDLVNIKDNNIAQFMKQGFDQKDAILMAQKVSWQKAGALMDQTAAKYNSPIAQANYAKMKSEATQQQMAIDQQLGNNSAQMLLKMRAPTGTAGGSAIKYDAKSGNYYKVDINGKVMGLATPSEAKTYEQTAKLRNGANAPSAASERFAGNSTVMGLDGSRYVADNPKVAATIQGRVDYMKKAKDAGERLKSLGTKIAVPLSAKDYSHNQEVDQALLDFAVATEKWENPTQAINAETLHDAKGNLNAGYWGRANNIGVIDAKVKEMEHSTGADIAKLTPQNEYVAKPGVEYGPGTHDDGSGEE